MHVTFVLLASLSSGAFCATAAYSATRAWHLGRTRGQAQAYDTLTTRLEPYLQAPREFLAAKVTKGRGLADEAEQWLRDSRHQ